MIYGPFSIASCNKLPEAIKSFTLLEKMRLHMLCTAHRRQICLRMSDGNHLLNPSRHWSWTQSQYRQSARMSTRSSCWIAIFWKENKWPAPVIKETVRLVMVVVDSRWFAEGEVFYCKGLAMSTMSAWARYALQFVFYSFVRVQKSSPFTLNLSPAPEGYQGCMPGCWAISRVVDTASCTAMIPNVCCLVVQYLCNWYQTTVA